MDLTIAQIERQYPSEWVVIRVTQVDRLDQATTGQVVAHNPDRLVVLQAAAQFTAEKPEAQIYVFFTGDLVFEGRAVVLASRKQYFPAPLPRYLRVRPQHRGIPRNLKSTT